MAVACQAAHLTVLSGWEQHPTVENSEVPLEKLLLSQGRELRVAWNMLCEDAAVLRISCMGSTSVAHSVHGGMMAPG